MAKDHSSKSLVGSSYEKISKFTFGFSRRTSKGPKSNNIPNPSQSATDTAKPLVSHTPPVYLHQPASHEAIPPPQNESFPPKVKPSKKVVRFLSSNIKKNRDGDRKELAGQQTFSEEKYNSYIDHTKMKMRAASNVSGGMRAPSNVSGGRTISRRESINDMFSSYINRTKLRLRTTSSVSTSK